MATTNRRTALLAGLTAVLAQCAALTARPPMPDPAVFRPADGWRRGASDTSIGRFGSLGSINPADIPAGCWQARYEKGIPVSNGFRCFSPVEKSGSPSSPAKASSSTPKKWCA